MKMTIYLPEELGDAIASREHLNVSGICQIALRDELGKRGRGPDAARASLADARAALDRIEVAIAEPRVTPDKIGLEIIGAWQALARAAEAHTSGTGDIAADLYRARSHADAARRLLSCCTPGEFAFVLTRRYLGSGTASAVSVHRSRGRAMADAVERERLLGCGGWAPQWEEERGDAWFAEAPSARLYRVDRLPLGSETVGSVDQGASGECGGDTAAVGT